MKSFKNKKCLLTGAASGIGKSTAIAIAKLGAELVLTDINEKGLEEVSRTITESGGKVLKCKAFDVSKYDEVKAFADEVHREFNAMDVVMNIAGTSTWGEVEDLQHVHWAKMINIDLWGPIHVIECFMPQMVRAGKGGHLLNVSSAAGLVALPLHVAYSAAKFGLRGISEVLRLDLKKHNIGVSVVCPGAVLTPLINTVEIVGIDRNAPKAKEFQDQFMARAVTPEKVAELIVKGIKKNKFLIITSPDIKALYYLKRRIHPLYLHIINKIAKIAKEVKAEQKG